MQKSKNKVWKKYVFEDGAVIYVRGMSANEKRVAVKEHGKLVAIIDTNIPW